MCVLTVWSACRWLDQANFMPMFLSLLLLLIAVRTSSFTVSPSSAASACSAQTGSGPDSELPLRLSVFSNSQPSMMAHLPGAKAASLSSA